MDESRKYNFEQKRWNTKECLLYDSFYINKAKITKTNGDKIQRSDYPWGELW